MLILYYSPGYVIFSSYEVAKSISPSWIYHQKTGLN